MPASGISSIVALSSMYRNLGISENTQSGAKITANHHGVANRYQQVNHKAARKIIEKIITSLVCTPLRRSSPMNGSPKDKERIKGYIILMR